MVFVADPPITEVVGSHPLGKLRRDMHDVQAGLQLQLVFRDADGVPVSVDEDAPVHRQRQEIRQRQLDAHESDGENDQLDEDDLDMFEGDDSFEDYGFEENWN